MTTMLLGRPLTFGDEAQIALIQKNEREIKESSYSKMSTEKLKKRIQEMEDDITDNEEKVFELQYEICDIEDENSKILKQIEIAKKILSTRQFL